MNTFTTLVKIETKLSLRSPDMMIFVILMPVIILVVVGLVYSGSPVDMVGLTFGAFLSIGICAVGLMGLPLILAEYRHRKVLKRLPPDISWY